MTGDPAAIWDHEMTLKGQFLWGIVEDKIKELHLLFYVAAVSIIGMLISALF